MQGIGEALGRIDPEIVVLQLSARPLPSYDAIGANANARVIAELNWGCGGGTHMAVCDVGPGTQIQLVADSISISAIYQGPRGRAGLGPDMLVASTVTYGARSGPQGAPGVTYTEGPYDFSLPIVSRVPPFAKSVALSLQNSAQVRTGGVVVTIEQDINSSFATPSNFILGAAEYGQRYGLSLPLRPDAQFVRVSGSAGAAGLAWLVYELAL